MQNKKLLVKRNWRYVVIISILFLVTIIVQDVTREIVIFRNDVVNLTESLETQMKADVKKEVDYRSAEMDNIIFDLKEDLIVHVNQNLEDLIFASDQIIDISSTELDSVKYERIETAVRDYNIADEEHVYFILNINGKLKYMGIQMLV